MYQTAAELSKKIKAALQAEFPQCQWSVTKKSYSGGRSITVALMAAPFAVFGEATTPYTEHAAHNGYAQLNEYGLRHNDPDITGYTSNGIDLTPEAYALLKRADEIANADNWDHSDSMTDYYDVNYAFSLEIGKWDRPFRQLDPAPAPAATVAPAAPAGAMTITQDRDWVWIEFASRPADDLIAALKGLGARWSKRRQAWYMTDSARLDDVMALA